MIQSQEEAVLKLQRMIEATKYIATAMYEIMKLEDNIEAKKIALNTMISLSEFFDGEGFKH